MENLGKTAVFPGGYGRIEENTTRAHMAGLGSIGYGRSETNTWPDSTLTFRLKRLCQNIQNYRPSWLHCIKVETLPTSM